MTEGEEKKMMKMRRVQVLKKRVKKTETWVLDFERKIVTFLVKMQSSFKEAIDGVECRVPSTGN